MTQQTIEVAMREWEARQPESITKDPLWTLNCFREALCLVDLVRDDVQSLVQAGTMKEAREQLLTAVGSIAANVAEGYGRATAADRARFLSYALGSAREAAMWYRTLQPSPLSPETVDRIERLARIRRMLLGLLGRLRKNGSGKFDPW